jgi:hypothetical protein
VLTAPALGDIRTEDSPNARAKCVMCKVKIAKGAWRFQLLTPDYYRDRGLTKQYGHAACYLRNVTAPAKPSTQSTSYWASSPEKSWTKPPALMFPASEAGDAVVAAIASGNLDQHTFEDQSLHETLPTIALQDCFVAAVTAAVPGSDALRDQEREVLELFCLQKRLTDRSASLLDALEKEEDQLPQPENNGDPLKSKFTQYSPNSRAHCRDCQKLIEEGDVRVGAHVFSSSSRHAGNSINYWCLQCMCAKASVKRMARLNATEIDKVLPGKMAALLLLLPSSHTVSQILLCCHSQCRCRVTRSSRHPNCMHSARHPDPGSTSAGCHGRRPSACHQVRAQVRQLGRACRRGRGRATPPPHAPLMPSRDSAAGQARHDRRACVLLRAECVRSLPLQSISFRQTNHCPGLLRRYRRRSASSPATHCPLPLPLPAAGRLPAAGCGCAVAPRPPFQQPTTSLPTANGKPQGGSSQFPGVWGARWTPPGPPRSQVPSNAIKSQKSTSDIQLGWVVRWVLSTPPGHPAARRCVPCTCRASTSLAPLYSPCATSSAFDWGSKPNSCSAPAPVGSSPGLVLSSAVTGDFRAVTRGLLIKTAV